MKSGLIGLPGTGKTVVFEALTGNIDPSGGKGENRIGTVRVPDHRVDALGSMYRPQKITYAQVEYFLPARGAEKERGSQWTPVRDCDALIHVLRNFKAYGLEPPHPADDIRTVDQELVLADYVVAEKRVERLELDRRRGKAVDPEELTRLQQCITLLEDQIPLRHRPDLAESSLLRGFAFLSAKPMLMLFNNDDEDEALPDLGESIGSENCLVIRGKLEQELAQMTGEEAEAFLKEFHIAAAATDRVIAKTYRLLGLISFFTVGDDEVKAWTIRSGISALDAADVIHSDMKKGFIRAEVLAYEDLMAAGSYAEARKHGSVRLEGKTYTVQDGDIINFRFNV